MRDEDEDRQLRSSGRIETNESFTFQISRVKNPQSFKPTEQGIKYSVLTASGYMIEQSVPSDKLKIINSVQGQIDSAKASVIPDDFRMNVLANYTLSFSPVNYA